MIASLRMCRILAGVIGLALPFTLIAADEEPVVEATVYYSKDDPRWKETDQAIETVEKAVPCLRVARVSIDSDEGYRQLAEAEKRLKIAESGEVTLVLGPLFLTSKDKRRGIEMYFGPMLQRVLKPEAGKGRLPADVPAYAKKHFGADAAVEALPDDGKQNIKYHRICKNGQAAGWVADAFQPIGCPVCNDAQALIAVSHPDLALIDVTPVRELERLGRKLEEKEQGAFTSQFKGHSLKKAEVRVDGVSGATKTSLAYEALIREIREALKQQ